MKRIGFIIKPHLGDDANSGALKLLEELVPFVLSEGHLPVVADDDQIAVAGIEIVPRDQLGKGLDLAVVIGGDGTILGASALVADEGVPVLGINRGRLGFLAAFDPRDAKDALQAALAGRLATSERMRLTVTYVPHEGEPVARAALNDAVIHQGSMARLIELEARLDGEVVSIYRADGLIVCTPTGSTAYNLAAGGPIIMPGQAAMVITPICAHSLTSRPLVVPESATVSVVLTEDSRGVVLTVDGQWAHSFLPGDRVEISAAERSLIVFESEKRYFDILREKLHWDARPSVRARLSTNREPDES